MAIEIALTEIAHLVGILDLALFDARWWQHDSVAGTYQLLWYICSQRAVEM
jgi:hypothetical protein